ncbi:MAG: MalY/PatB family protein [Rhizobiaceae bacterium]
MMPEKFDFDDVINRRNVPALKVHQMVLGEDGMDLFPAGVADMDFRAPQPVLAAMSQRLAHGVFGYETLPDGLYPALTGWMKDRHGWGIDPNYILRAPNVLNSLAMAANLFTNPGDGIIIQPPVFFDFADIIAENGRRLVENPLVLAAGRYEMDFGCLEASAADPRTKMLFLCNPHNPVGRVWSKLELAKLGEICRQHDVLVVADEIHGDITFAGHTYTPFATVSNADALNSITCLSPAKSFNIAACCGAFTIVPDEGRRNAFKVENSRLTVNKNNAFANVAMEAAYKYGGTWMESAISYIEGNLSLVRASLNDIPKVTLIEPEGTFLLWLDFRAMNLSQDDLTRFLRVDAGWAITRGVSFGKVGEGFGRLNIACPRTHLQQALDGLNNAFSKKRDRYD